MTTNATLTREYCCAQCYGAVVERRTVSGEYMVSCPKGCQPGGFVTLTFAAERRAVSVSELEEVARAYPQLDPRPKLTPDQRARLTAALYTEDEDTD